MYEGRCLKGKGGRRRTLLGVHHCSTCGGRVVASSVWLLERERLDRENEGMLLLLADPKAQPLLSDPMCW